MAYDISSADPWSLTAASPPPVHLESHDVAGTVDTNWDPLGGSLPPPAERYRRSREADNVLGSYFHASDLLAEALQNAADAIDDRAETEGDSDWPRIIEVDFAPVERRFAVTDTGTGMSREALDIVFQPNVTLKSGPLARPSSRTWRGEKGVGLSFLLFACDELRIQTCDGRRRYDAVIRGAASWAADPDGNPAIEHELTVSEPDVLLSSARYTVITLSAVDAERFDVDLFGMSVDEVEWTMRTRTAVGNTAYLFRDLGVDQPDEIEVLLRYGQSASAESDGARPVPYRYATPEALLAEAARLKVIAPIRTYDFEEVASLGAAEIRKRLDGAAVRYAHHHVTPSGFDVYMYMFAMAGDLMADVLTALTEKGRWVPTEWSGFWVATRDMPTGIPLRGGVLPTRGYEQRTFGLLQRDDLKLDVGRKSLHGRTAKMFKDVVREVWNDDMRWVVERIPRSRRGKGLGALEIERRAKRALEVPDLGVDLPFRKEPRRRSDVAAVFHEMIASARRRIPVFHGLTTGLVTDSDLLATNGQPDVLHVLFATDQEDVLAIFDTEQAAAETVDLAVVWDITDTADRDANDGGLRIETMVSSDPYGATHRVHFDGLGGREAPLSVISLVEVLTES